MTEKSSNSVEAPLLQYNALIAMLKSNASAKAQKEHILNLKGVAAAATAAATSTASSNRNKKSSNSNLPISPNHNHNHNNAITATLTNKSSSPKLINKSSSKNKHQQRDANASSSSSSSSAALAKWSTFKKYQVIDADSISLASLSESPPSEFKFSDEEETNNNNNNNNSNDYDEETARVIRQSSLLLNKQHQINEAVNKIRKLSTTNSFDSKLTNTTNNNNNNKGSNQMRNTTPPVANVSEHIGSNTNASNHMSEINKNLEKQRVLQEQMNQIKIAKKNFHAVLLKDAKCKNENLIRHVLETSAFEKNVSFNQT
jgi:hypothetical protein